MAAFKPASDEQRRRALMYQFESSPPSLSGSLTTKWSGKSNTDGFRRGADERLQRPAD